MTTRRMPLRIRLGVALVAVLAVAAVAGASAVVQIGAQALHVGGGFVVSAGSGPETQWAGIEVRNQSAFPITLHSVDPRTLADAEILETRVSDVRTTHLLLSREPLSPDLQRVLDRSRPLDGFVLPPHSGTDYQVLIRFRPRSPGKQTVMAREAVTYSVFGLDHGAISDGVYCVRAPGSDGCPPFG